MTSDEADRCGPPTHVWRMHGLKNLHFECRPIAQRPPEKTLAFMYRTDGPNLCKAGVMIFKDGDWQKVSGCKVNGTPSHWVAMVDATVG